MYIAFQARQAPRECGCFTTQHLLVESSNVADFASTYMTHATAKGNQRTLSDRKNIHLCGVFIL